MKLIHDVSSRSTGQSTTRATGTSQGEMQRHGTNWPLEPRPLAPPLGRPPPPPPPSVRPLAPPLGQPPPPPPPAFRPPVVSPSLYPQDPPPPPTSHPPPPHMSHPPPPPTSNPPPLPPSQPSPPPSSTLVPPPPPPAPHHPSLPPQPHNPLHPPHPSHPPLPHKEDTDSQTSVSHPAAIAAPNITSSSSKESEKGDDNEHTSSDKPKGFGGMKFRGSNTVLGKRVGGTISMKIGKTQVSPEAKKAKVTSPPIKKTALVSQAFGDESDEEEEMPPEAKLRMRNLGKDTPTSSGPNSFHKTKMGFSDPRAGYKRYYEDD